MAQTSLFTNRTTTGESAVFSFTDPGTCYIRGLNGGKLQLLISPNVSPEQWKPLVNFGDRRNQHTVSAQGAYKLKANLAAVTSTTSLNVIVETP